MTTATDGLTTLLEPRALPNFVETSFIQVVVDRALTHLAAGFPLQVRGALGTENTTPAMQGAGRLGRQVVMAHGNEELSASGPGGWGVRVPDEEGDRQLHPFGPEDRRGRDQEMGGQPPDRGI